MQIFEDVDSEQAFLVSFDFDDWEKIKLESARSGRLIPVVVLEVLSCGIERYQYTTKQNATY